MSVPQTTSNKALFEFGKSVFQLANIVAGAWIFGQALGEYNLLLSINGLMLFFTLYAIGYWLVSKSNPDKNKKTPPRKSPS